MPYVPDRKRLRVKRILSKRPSAALVISCMSLFVALGGVSYGVATGSIDSREIKNDSVRGADVKNRSLTGSDIAKDRLGGGAIKEATLGKVPASSVRWALIEENGAIEEQSGGFTVVSKPGINSQTAENPNIYISAGSSLAEKGLSATIAIQNQVDRGGKNGTTADPAFKGDVAVGRCATAAITCVPAGTNLDSVLVVRALADNNDANAESRRFYVEVTE